MSCITPLILTYNEAPNLERSLARLAWAEEILIVDSGSDLAILGALTHGRLLPLFVLCRLRF